MEKKNYLFIYYIIKNTYYNKRERESRNGFDAVEPGNRNSMAYCGQIYLYEEFECVVGILSQSVKFIFTLPFSSSSYLKHLPYKLSTWSNTNKTHKEKIIVAIIDFTYFHTYHTE